MDSKGRPQRADLKSSRMRDSRCTCRPAGLSYASFDSLDRRPDLLSSVRAPPACIPTHGEVVENRKGPKVDAGGEDSSMSNRKTKPMGILTARSQQTTHRHTVMIYR